MFGPLLSAKHMHCQDPRGGGAGELKGLGCERSSLVCRGTPRAGGTVIDSSSKGGDMQCGPVSKETVTKDRDRDRGANGAVGTRYNTAVLLET